MFEKRKDGYVAEGRGKKWALGTAEAGSRTDPIITTRKMAQFELHTALANIVLTAVFLSMNYGTFRLARQNRNALHWIMWGMAVFATTYLFTEIGLMYIHEMERYVVVCFSQAFSSLLFIILSIQKMNRAIAHGSNMKRIMKMEEMTSSMDGVIPALGTSLFQVLYLWVGTVPSA